ncbi:unnamed protein product [Microthlaspi erraticum]|uniref:F-box domain-containing protein n=1 Tax=Microthlaspi erraticum TaxID=1685480 RepID=A0A6D2HDA5_9BRAS|nr:unnamed protein product [Microthlaspi erraticum]
MENLEQHDLLLATQPSNSVREYSDPIPCDILIDIFSRVPGWSIARFRCVSKYWGSILRRPDFTELFLTKSLARPRILFAMEVGKELLFFSSPQPQNPADNSTLLATRYKRFPKKIPYGITPPLYGLLLLRGDALVCNPFTGESITLPEMKTRTYIDRSFFGYDPINKQFKVLCKTYGSHDSHCVLTLGSSGKDSWRYIQSNPHYSLYGRTRINGEICINGLLYYEAQVEESKCIIVSFDLSSEKFGYIKIDQEILGGTLINYKGNLGALVRHENEFVLWVLEEDAGNHKWCKRISVPLSLLDENGNYLHFVGMAGAGEIVFLPHRARSQFFYIVYYNIERKTFTRVIIQGFEELKDPFITPRIFLDYVENMRLL